jgi:DNA-binding response OmpR family regulator
MAARVALLLCNDEEVHDLAGTWLTRAGLNVISARDGKSAVSTVAGQSVDILIIDALPISLSDFPSLRSLKQQFRKLRVLLIPSLNQDLDVGLARISGVDAVLARPMSRSALLSALNG